MSTVVGAVAHVKLQREKLVMAKTLAVKLQLSAEQLVDTQTQLDRALQQWL